ncbi:MAG: PepSY domain-containing protein [Nitrospira sp.]|nr:MAG: PepSY domain-containing protein [Nitrospira sp.]
MSNEVAATDQVSRLSVPSGRGASRLNRARTWRRLWLDAHLYLGLFVGAVLVVFGLTGSVLVWWQELDEWINPGLLTVTVPPLGQDGHRPLREILAAAEQAAAPGSRMTQLYGPATRERVFAIYAAQPSKAWQRIYVDPYRAQVTGVRNYGAHEWVPSYLLDIIFQLHFALFLGETGVMTAAVCALFLILSLITGVIVWWPLTGQWRQAFALRWPSSPVRLTFDLHKTFSLYTCLVLGAVLLSGVCMNWNEPFVWVTQQFSPATRGPAQELVSAPKEGVAPISPERAVALAAILYPEGRLSSISMPEDATGVYQVGRQGVPGLSRFWSERIVTVEQYSGAILDIRAPDTRRSAGETFLDWQWPLHSGQAFGMPGRLLVCASGLACPVIYVTGVLMWWRKRRSRRTRHA